jgi:nitrilase
VNRVTVAAVQAAPVYLDRAATVARVVELTTEAAGLGAEVIVFPEAFVPTYPDWIWRISPADGALQDAYFERWLANTMMVPGPETELIGKAAKKAHVFLVVGVNERVLRRGTVYNSILFYGPDGALLSRRRKLMPTSSERVVWGMGDGSTLEVHQTPYGGLGGLICWENYMPLARFAMYAQGIDLYCAPTWIWGKDEGWQATLRHIALEGRVAVISAAIANRTESVPNDLPGRDQLYGEPGWICPGGSVIVGPGGETLAGPLYDTEGILTAEIDLDGMATLRRALDVAGHYARPDVFRLVVNTSPRPIAELSATEAPPLGRRFNQQERVPRRTT